MKIGFAAINLACICAVAVSQASAGYYLYAPRPTEDIKPAASREEGIVVKEITIRKGDTLSGISRANSGHASYFPQILLFNEIRNPNLIYAGKTLRVSVTKEVKEEKTVSKEEEKVNAAPPVGKKKKQKKSVAKKTKVESARVKRPVAAKETSAADAEQALFEKAVNVYRTGSCQEGVPLFDAFLKTYPNSSHAADIALLRADCHLKLSGE